MPNEEDDDLPALAAPDVEDPSTWVYDDEGNIYLDPAGRLKDKNDRGFSLPKLSAEKERARLALFNIVNSMLKTDEMPLCKETYDRLRAEGAGDLEARSLLTSIWMNEVWMISQMPDEPDEERMARQMVLLKPHERDSSGNIKK